MKRMHWIYSGEVFKFLKARCVWLTILRRLAFYLSETGKYSLQLYAYDIILQKLEVTNWDFRQLIFHFSEGVGRDYTWMRFYSSEAEIFLYQKERKFSIQKILEFNGKCHCNDIVNDLRLHRMAF